MRLRGSRLSPLLGMLSHLTMAAAVVIATLWVYLEWRAEHGPAAALSATRTLMAPALAATAAVVAFVFIAAALSPLGLRVGGYQPFSALLYITALDDLSLWTIGLGTPWPWLVPISICVLSMMMLVRAPSWLGRRARLYALLILVVPLGILAVRAGNSGFARYYLMSAVGLLLFLSEWIARGLAGRPAVRIVAATLVVAVVIVSLYRDSVLIREQRGRPDSALADIAALSPAGARIAFAELRLKGVVAVAAERSGYPARFARDCAPADFLLASQSRWAPTPMLIESCGIQMQAIDSSVTIPLTGDSWVLYRPKSLAKLRGR